MNKMKVLALILKSFILCLFAGATVKLISFWTDNDDIELTFLLSGCVALILVAIWIIYQVRKRSRALVAVGAIVIVINALMVAVLLMDLDTLRDLING